MKNKIIYIFVIIFMLMIFGTTISNAGSAESAVITDYDITLPVLLTKQNGYINFYVDSIYTLSEMAFTTNPTGYTMTKKTLSNGLIQVTLTLPYSMAKTITPTKYESSLTTKSIEFRVAYRGNSSIIAKQTVKVVIPSIYFIGEELSFNVLYNREGTINGEGVIKSTPTTAEAYSYIWDNFTVESSDDKIVKVTDVDKQSNTKFIIKYKTIEPGTAYLNLVSPTNQKVKVTTIKVLDFKLDKTQATLIKGEKVTLKITEGGHSGIKWKSSNTDVAKIESVGTNTATITTVGAGQATITATSNTGEHNVSCLLTVKAELKLDKTEIVINKNENATIKVSSGASTGYKWTISNKDIIQIGKYSSTYATIIGKEVGTATVTLTAGNQTKTCTVKVQNFKLDKQTAQLVKGDTLSLNIADGGHEGVKWQVSNTNIIKVSSSNNGSATVKALNTGTAIITATSSDGKFKTSCSITVDDELKLDKTEVVVNKDEKVTINVSSGEKAEYKWSVSDENIIQIENSSSTDATIIGKEVGTATVTLTAENQTKTCTVKVQNFKLDKQTAQLVDGETLTLNIADGGHSGVKWQVSNTNVIKISSSSNGSVKIKALKAGTATITATSSDGKYKTSCEITVDDELKFEKKQMEVKKGERITIRVSSGEKAEYKWSVSNENIIQIETSGSNYATIIGKEVGTATVTLTVGNQTCTCNVEVEARNFKVPYKVKDKKYCLGMKTNLKREDIEKDLNIKDFKIKDKNNKVISNTEKIGTGMKLEIDNYEYVMVVQGDTTGDGKITITDVAKAQLHFVKLEELTGAYLQAADTNYSENITITDVARLQLAFLGLVEL